MFPFVTVVECPEAKMVEAIGPTLVCTAITGKPDLQRQLLDAVHIDRLNFGPVPTSKLNWLQPHEGNIVEFLFRARAYQEAGVGRDYRLESSVGSQLLVLPSNVRMRILSITAGAAGMYCGSCFRDNALAAELLTRGHDAHLVPVYTPTRTDEPNVSERRVLFGGISVYLQQSWPLFRRLPRAFDRALGRAGRDRRVREPVGVHRPGAAGRADRRDARGHARACWRREFDKLVEWTRGRAAARRHQPARIRSSSPWRRRCARPSAGPSAARCRARSCSSTACSRRIGIACSS